MIGIPIKENGSDEKYKNQRVLFDFMETTMPFSVKSEDMCAIILRSKQIKYSKQI